MFVLGFGIIEEQERKKIKDRLLRAAIAGENLDDVEKEWREKSNKYDKMSREEAPERYTSFFLHSDRIVYHHINRRHAFSPDGWALLKVEERLDKTGEIGLEFT